jgi:tetratricopeptide (TPR) repeat protein
MGDYDQSPEEGGTEFMSLYDTYQRESKKEKKGFSLKLPRFMKREAKPAAVSRQHTAEVDLEETYAPRRYSDAGSSNPMAALTTGGTAASDLTSGLDLRSLHDSHDTHTGATLHPDTATANTLPKPVLKHKASSNMNFAEAYDKPTALSLQDNPVKKRDSKKPSLPPPPPPDRSPPHSPPQDENLTSQKGNTVSFGGSEGLQSFKISSRQLSMDDMYVDAASPKARVKPKAGEKNSKTKSKTVSPKADAKGSGGVSSFFGFFRKKNSSKEINKSRSESAALKKLKSLSSQEMNKPEIVVTKNSNQQGSKNKSKRRQFNENDPNSPALISLKENLQFQAGKTIEFASQNEFDKSIDASLDVVAAARVAYESCSQANKSKCGIDLALLLEWLGDVYKSIGEFDRAAKCLAEALATRRAVKSGAQQVAATFTDLGLIFCDAGKFEEGYDCFEEAYSILSEYHEDGRHPDVAASLGNLGVALRGLGQCSESVNAGEKAVRLMEELCGKHDLNTLQQKALIAVSLVPAGDPGLSAHMLTKAIAVAEKELGYSRDHPWLAYLHHELGKATLLTAEAEALSPSMSDE